MGSCLAPYYYRQQTKLREGNVFRGVCLSTGGSLSGGSLSRQVSVWCGLCRGGSLSGRVGVSVRASRSYTRANSAKFASTLLHCRSPSIKFPKNLLYRAPVLAPPPLYRPPNPLGHIQTCSTWTSLHTVPALPPTNMFKFIPHCTGPHPLLRAHLH